MLLTAVIFIAILGFLIFIHELGHFWAAKRAGVRVEEFAFGFRPRLFAKQIGETTYAINLIPLGGYVKMFGEDATESGPRSYRNKTIAQRFWILIAGVLMNFIFGWFVFTLLFATGFTPLYPGVGSNPFVTSTQEVKIGAVAVGSPAEQAGLMAGDIVKQINGKTIAVDQEFLMIINANRGKEVELTYLRQGYAGADTTIRLIPRENPPAGQGALGVTIESAGEVSSSIVASSLAGFYEAGKMVGGSAVGFYQFVKRLVVQQEVSEEVTGLIGVGALTDATRKLGIDYLAQLVALVTIGLATINLMPILPLDGGHIAALAYEKVARRPLSEKQLGTLATAGLAFVLLIFVVVTYKDVVRFDILGRIF